MLEAILGIIMIVFGAGAILTLIIAGGSIVNGWALSIAWGYIMVPVFHLPVLSIPAAIGISAIISFFTADYSYVKEELDKEEKKKKTINALSVAFLRPAGLILITWIVNHWIQ